MVAETPNQHSSTVVELLLRSLWWVGVVFAIVPYGLMFVGLPCALGLFRLETDWIQPCVDHLRDVQASLIRGAPVPEGKLVCPCTGACYHLLRTSAGWELLCPGIHYELRVLWTGLGQRKFSGSHYQPGLSVRRRVSLKLDATGEVHYLLPAE